MSAILPTDRKLRVAVLMGGTSSERAVSLSTGSMIVKALDSAKYEVSSMDTADLPALLAEDAGPHSEALTPGPSPTLWERGESVQGTACCAPTPEAPTPGPSPKNRGGEKDTQAPACISPPSQRGTSVLGKGDGGLGPRSNGHAPAVHTRPDVVFIALHGKGGEDGTIQGMLELLGLPYTGSGVLASALAMDKAMTKRLLRSAGIPVIDEVTIPRGHGFTDAALRRHVVECLGDGPVFVKPNAEGSTFGCTLVSSPAALPQAVAHALTYDRLALIEKYVRGTEITVGVLGNAGAELQVLPIIEIVPKGEFYDYESKYAEGGSEHIIPARLSEARTRQAQAFARQCHQLLGCRGMSRADMIVTNDALCVLEVNTIPGMTPTSLLPQAAEQAGISFSALLDRLIISALPEEE